LFQNIVQKDIVYPDSIIIKVGSSATFYCNSLTHVTWKFNRDDLPSSVSTLSNGDKKVLFIKEVAIIHGGIYSCWSEETEYVIYEGTSFLKVNGKKAYKNFACILSNLLK